MMSRVVGGSLEMFMRTHHLGRVPPQHVRMIAGMILRWIRETLNTSTTADISRFIRPHNITFGSMWDASTIRVNAELDPVTETSYVCPEARTGKPYTVQSACVWALGTLVYHLLTGDLPSYSNWITYHQIVWANPQYPLLIVFVQEMLCISDRPNLVDVGRLINDYI
jgi:hypothetical protein